MSHKYVNTSGCNKPSTLYGELTTLLFIGLADVLSLKRLSKKASKSSIAFGTWI